MSNDKKFNLIYNKYRNYIYNICLRYAKNESDAEDYMHDAFIKINKIIENVDLNKCKTFLTTITINSCIDNLRKTKKHNNNISENDINNTEYTVDNSTIYNLYEYDDIKSFVNKSADKIGSRYVNIFSMFVFDDYMHKEIAEKLNMNINTVRVDYMKARKMVCDLLIKEKIIDNNI